MKRLCLNLLLFVFAACQSVDDPILPSESEVNWSHVQVLPKATHEDIDIDVKAGDTLKHQVFYPIDGSLKNQLLVFIPGTGADPALHYREFCELAVAEGFHAIGLVYKNATSISDICGAAATTDPQCSEDARLEIIYGWERSTAIEVNRANSIEYRLMRLLDYLRTSYPEQAWNQYLDSSSGTLQWDQIVFAGHSQGGGHAALIARDQLVAKTILFNSPSDRNTHIDNPLHQPPWFYDQHVTPNAHYYAFYHQQNGGDNRLAVYELFGLGEFGAEVNVDLAEPPYANSHILFTDQNTFDYSAYTNPSCQGGDGFNAHSDIIVDCEVPFRSDQELAYQDVWKYLLIN